MSPPPPTWEDEYGPDFLQRIREPTDARALETLWRWRHELQPIAAAMAASGDAGLAALLGEELLAGQVSTQLSSLPDLLRQNRTRVTSELAGRIHDRLADPEHPLPAEYQAGSQQLTIWLLCQPGDESDALAIRIACGDHPYGDTDQVLDAALQRVVASPSLGARLVDAFSTPPERWTTGSGWTRTARILAAAGTNPRGRAALMRRLTRDLFELPSTDQVQPEPGVLRLIQKHAHVELVEGLNGPELLAQTPQTTLIVQAVAGLASKPRGDAIAVVSAHQAAVWSAHRAELTATWSEADWRRALSRWAGSGRTLLDVPAVIAAAPSTTLVEQLRVAIVHGAAPGDPIAQAAVSRLQTAVAAVRDTSEAISVVVSSVPWDLLSDPTEVDYVSWIINSALGPDEVGAAIVAAYDAGRIPAQHAVKLVPPDQHATALGRLAPSQKRAAYASALHDNVGDPISKAAISTFIDSSTDTFDLVEAMAPLDPDLAFGTFDEARWHDRLDTLQKDRLVDLLDQYATLAQRDLLDRIAADSDGGNSGRRARAAKRWAALTDLHSEISPGVLSLLESAKPVLNEAFAEVAALVQPHDEVTLASLKSKWLSGGKPGAAARAAFDAVANGVITSLHELHALERREQGSELLRLLGLTASDASFPELLSYVGADAVDDNLQLRQSASESIAAFVEVAKLKEDQIDAVGARIATESDPTANGVLRAALTAAKLGDDAAILGLYRLANYAPTLSRTPDELFGSEKPRLLTALKKMYIRKALGESGWDGYVEQMNLVAEALARVTYLKFGTTKGILEQIREGRPNKPEYGNLLGALRSTQGFSGMAAQLETINEARKTRTSAHHPTGDPLDVNAIVQCEAALKLAAQDILNHLVESPITLRVVPQVAPESEEAS